MLAGIKDDDVSNILLVDVTPLSLGIEFDDDNKMEVIVERNCPVPIK